jgi:hypothetical protein
MTPKEKAEELLHKMQLDWGCNCCYNDWAKECALIAVDEIISVIDPETNLKTWFYFKEVKHEIENL